MVPESRHVGCRISGAQSLLDQHPMEYSVLVRGTGQADCMYLLPNRSTKTARAVSVGLISVPHAN